MKLPNINSKWVWFDFYDSGKLHVLGRLSPFFPHKNVHFDLVWFHFWFFCFLQILPYDDDENVIQELKIDKRKKADKHC